MCELKSLEKLDLNNNKLVTFPKAIEEIISLKNINFSNNQLTNLPESIKNFSALKTLNVENNPLRDDIKDMLKRLKADRELYIFF